MLTTFFKRMTISASSDYASSTYRYISMKIVLTLHNVCLQTRRTLNRYNHRIEIIFSRHFSTDLRTYVTRSRWIFVRIVATRIAWKLSSTEWRTVTRCLTRCQCQPADLVTLGTRCQVSLASGCLYKYFNQKNISICNRTFDQCAIANKCNLSNAAANKQLNLR